MRPLSTAALLCAVPALAPAQNLTAKDVVLGSETTLVHRADPVTGESEILGACGGSVHSLALVDGALYLGSVDGAVYVYDEALQFPVFAFQSEGDATAMVDLGDELLVGASDGVLRRYDPATGTLLGSASVGLPIRALCYQHGPGAGDLLVGSISGLILRGDPVAGGFQHVGTCGADITAMASAEFRVHVADTAGQIWTFDSNDMTVAGIFTMPEIANALGVLEGDLLVAGDQGKLRRLDAASGETKSELSLWIPVHALVQPHLPAPGVTTCTGSACPCGNLDGDNGCANSTGHGAELLAFGSSSVSQDDLGFYAYDLPPNVWTLFMMGSSPQFQSWGAGVLCVSGAGGSIHRFPVQSTGSFGFVELGPGLVALADSTFSQQGLIAAGTTWYFQALYRDPQGPCFTMNSSPAYGVTFEQ